MPLLGTRGVASARGFGLFGLIPGDPFFSSTTLLLPGNGTNGAQNNTFLDSSTNAFSITRNGNTTQGTFSPFPPASGTAYSAAANGGSGYFDGTGDNLTVPDNDVFSMGNGNFTIEFWMYPLSSNRQFITWQGDNSGTNSSASFSVEITSTSKVRGSVYSSGAAYDATSVASITTNAWTHVALVRNGNTNTLYLNGSSDGTVSVVGVFVDNSAQPVKIGDYTTAGGGLPFSGYLSGFRIVKGTAVYTANFTPPTAPLTAITNTSLLLNFTNAGIFDATAKNDLETVGNAQISTAQSKWGGASIAFDGTGDWLLGPDNTNLQLGSGDFTIEGWVYLNATGVAYGLASKGAASTGWSVNVTSGNKLQFSYTATALTGATSLASGTWYHFAVVRNGSGTGNLRVYLNGTADATSAGAVTDNFNQTNVLYTGADRVGGSALNGYIDDLRITKGVARYTANFTAPTAAFPLY
jgi:hypothetical protein